MTQETKDTLLHTATLLEKAASLLELSHNLEKEASAAADEMISRGMASTNQKEFFKDYLVDHPEKIATIKAAFSDIPTPNAELGKPAGLTSSQQNSGMDEFDLALMS